MEGRGGMLSQMERDVMLVRKGGNEDVKEPRLLYT